jgi:hypothetical protein
MLGITQAKTKIHYNCLLSATDAELTGNNEQTHWITAAQLTQSAAVPRLSAAFCNACHSSLSIFSNMTSFLPFTMSGK